MSGGRDKQRGVREWEEETGSQTRLRETRDKLSGEVEGRRNEGKWEIARRCAWEARGLNRAPLPTGPRAVLRRQLGSGSLALRR